MALIDALSTETAKAAIDEAERTIIADLLKELQPALDAITSAATELRGTLARVNAILDKITGEK